MTNTILDYRRCKKKTRTLYLSSISKSSVSRSWGWFSTSTSRTAHERISRFRHVIYSATRWELRDFHFWRTKYSEQLKVKLSLLPFKRLFFSYTIILRQTHTQTDLTVIFSQSIMKSVHELRSVSPSNTPALALNGIEQFLMTCLRSRPTDCVEDLQNTIRG